MSRLIKELKIDFSFIKSHTLQPQWYKVLKVFILFGFFIGYFLLFGFLATIICFATFITLSATVHMVYRIKTVAWTQSWLDFVVVNENNEGKAESIGKYYYSAVIINALVSIAVSQLVLVLI